MPQNKIKKILVIEDDQAMREIINHKLKNEEFEVQTAENGREGAEMVNQFKPDLVLLDLMLPEIDGFGVLKIIRESKDSEISKIPVIVLSNLWSNADILRAKQLEVQAYLVKAYFTPNEILGKIQDVLNNPNQTIS